MEATCGSDTEDVSGSVLGDRVGEDDVITGNDGIGCNTATRREGTEGSSVHGNSVEV